MDIIWAQKEFTGKGIGRRGIFLAGPTLRKHVDFCETCNGSGVEDPEHICLECQGMGKIWYHSWRLQAIESFKSAGFQGELYIPEPKDCEPFSGSQLDGHMRQIYWERQGLARARVILFWIPRDKELLPGFTTNIEFGEWYKSGKCVLGYPDSASKMGYIEYIAKEQGVLIARDLDSTIKNALKLY